MLHTTYRHTADGPRYRAILLTNRPVIGAEYRKLWLWIESLCLRQGHPIGHEAMNPSRFWYAPGVAPGGEFLSAELAGGPLDVDAALIEMAELDAQRRAAKPKPIASNGARLGGSRATRYAQGALAKAAEKVRTAPEGERNSTLNAEAFSITGFVAAGTLEQATAEGALHEAAIASGLEPGEVQATLRSAFIAGIERPRALPPTDLEGRQRHNDVPRRFRIRVSRPWRERPRTRWAR
jgi:hypothetical protein